MAVVALLAIVLIGKLLTASPSWTAMELNILETLSRSHTAWLDSFALAINFLFSPPIAVIIVLVVSTVILGVTRKFSTAIEFAVLVAGSWLGSELIKAVVHRLRPDHLSLAHSLLLETSPSFPSGHTAFATSLMMGFIVLAHGRRWRSWVIAAGVLVAVLVAFSRVYLGVHYVSDVTASIVYSMVAVSLIAMLWNRFVPLRPPTAHAV